MSWFCKFHNLFLTFLEIERIIYVRVPLVLSFIESPISVFNTLQYFFSFLRLVCKQFKSVNHTSYFRYFQISGKSLYYRISSSVIYRYINFNSQPLFQLLFVARIEFLSYTIYFGHLKKIKHYLYLWPSDIVIFGKFNSNYYTHFQDLFLVRKLCKSGLQVIQLSPDHLKNMDNVDIGGYMIVRYLEKVSLYFQFLHLYFFNL